MAFRRGFRRRKPTVAWLPILGQNDGSTDGYLEDTLAFGPGVGDANTATQLHAIVPDYPAEAIGGAVETLADLRGSGYRLRRIVGKFAVGVDRDGGDGGQTTYPEAVLVTAGYIILRVDTATGAPLQAATPRNYSLLDPDNTRDPWIWRRSWVLGNPFGFAGAGGANTALAQSPSTNTQFGSVSDGPHIDQSTARRVTLEERLIFIVTCVALRGLAASVAGRIRYCLEARYLTSPLTVMGNKRNASR